MPFLQYAIVLSHLLFITHAACTPLLKTDRFKTKQYMINKLTQGQGQWKRWKYDTNRRLCRLWARYRGVTVLRNRGTNRHLFNYIYILRTINSEPLTLKGLSSATRMWNYLRWLQTGMKGIWNYAISNKMPRTKIAQHKITESFQNDIPATAILQALLRFHRLQV